MVLLDGFLELVLLGGFVFAGFGGLAVKLFGCKLGIWGLVEWGEEGRGKEKVL